MYTIKLCDENLVTLKVYTTSITPIIGDVYAMQEFEDNKQREVIRRLLITNVPNTIIITLKTSL